MAEACIKTPCGLNQCWHRTTAERRSTLWCRNGPNRPFRKDCLRFLAAADLSGYVDIAVSLVDGRHDPDGQDKQQGHRRLLPPIELFANRGIPIGHSFIL
jgi:hypothetical protein